MARSCNFTFTHNNYADTSIEDKLECRYIVYGKEEGESGTPHLQGTVVFPTQRTLTSVIKKLPGCHVELCIALHSSIAYCKKEGDFTERGTPPATKKELGQDEQERWKEYRQAAEAGEFEKIPEKIRFNQPKLLATHRDLALRARKLPDTETEHLWYYGDSGTGKSRKARTEHPDAYLKNANKWWCGYTDQETVLLEDFDKRHEMLVHHMKIWGDRYPFNAETKGSSQTIRPRLIIVTSNYHPRDIWTDDADLEPILRRFKCEHFGEIKGTKRKIANLEDQISKR